MKLQTVNKYKEFKKEVIMLCKKYDISISHEDEQGAFLLVNGFDEIYGKWFCDAREGVER